MTYEEVENVLPYILDKEAKKKILLERLNFLTGLHYSRCPEYKRFCDTFCDRSINASNLQDVPFLPVSIFKNKELLSINREEIFKTMTSSGTTRQQVSKIFLDKVTASHQQKALVKIVSSFTGDSRMPMIILDSSAVIKDRVMFSARGAGILGFSIFGTKKIYAFDDNMNINLEELRTFLKKYEDKTIFLFGFTFMIWEYFYKKLKESGETLPIKNGVLIHGGGWKKLIHEAVSKEQFKNALSEVCGIKKVYDYYGMVEQTGSIFMECEEGHFHASIFSDILIRKMSDFSVCSINEPGVIQVFSAIPESYPGHSLLTEDRGVFLGEDDCPCGRKGKYFDVLGRIKNAEIRGCSDTFEK